MRNKELVKRVQTILIIFDSIELEVVFAIN